MLRRLEEKEYPTSTFLRRISGPSRSAIQFYPTAQARKRLQELVARTFDPEQWHRLQEKILSNLAKRRAAQRRLAQEVLGRIRDHENSLLNSAQAMTALLLTLPKQIAAHFREHVVVKTITRGKPRLELSLDLLPAFLWGSL